jgi:hypothetical protein
MVGVLFLVSLFFVVALAALIGEGPGGLACTLDRPFFFSGGSFGLPRGRPRVGVDLGFGRLGVGDFRRAMGSLR